METQDIKERRIMNDQTIPRVCEPLESNFLFFDQKVEFTQDRAICWPKNVFWDKLFTKVCIVEKTEIYWNLSFT